MPTRKEYGRKSSRATKKARTSKKASPLPLRLSRAKTLAGQKRALQKEATRLAKERFLVEKLARESRAARAQGQSLDPVRKAFARGARKALRVTREHVAILRERISTNVTGQRERFEEFLERPDMIDHMARVHPGRADMVTRLGEHVTEFINLYLTKDSIPEILSALDAITSQIQGSYDIWNVAIFLFTDGKTEMSYTTPIPGGNAFQASYEMSGVYSSYREARASMQKQMEHFVEYAKGLLFVSYGVVSSTSPRQPPRKRGFFSGLVS